jgi:autotransporter-associated beta strand protein
LQAENGARVISNAVTLDGATITGTNDLNLSGLITLNANAEKTLTVDNTGMTTLSGTVTINNGTNAGRALVMAVNSGRSATISAKLTNGTNTGSLKKANSGTLYITGNSNDYSAGTTVLRGSLYANNSSGSATGSGAVNVTPDSTTAATLAGSGFISGNVTATGANGGYAQLSAGATSSGIAKLSLNANVSLSGSTKTLLTLNSAGTAGTHYSQLGVGSSSGQTLSLSGLDNQLRITLGGGYTPVNGDRFTLILVQGTADAISGTYSSLYMNNTLVTLDGNSQFNYGGNQWQLSYTGDSNAFIGGNDLVLGVIPEPSTFAMLLGGIGMLGILRRRRIS